MSRASDGQAALRRAIVEAVTAKELALCERVADGVEPYRGPSPSPSPSDEQVRLAGSSLVRVAGVRWRNGGWTVLEARR